MTAIDDTAGGNGARRQRGATLIVGMILLLLMTAVGLTSLKAIKTDERMAGNLEDRYVAFQAAEAALRDAENLLADPALPTFQRSQGMYHFDQDDVPEPFDFTFDAANRNARQYTGDLGAVAAAPLYIIEQMEGGVEQGSSLVVGTRYGGEWRACYRITAIGFGGSATTRVVLQTTYRR